MIHQTAPAQVTALAVWLSPLEDLPLECDGLTRVMSILLCRERVAHTVMVGGLAVEGHGVIPHHWWIALGGDLDGWLVDYRARMWLGPSPTVPHGLHCPAAEVTYDGTSVEIACNPTVLSIFAVTTGDSRLKSYPPLILAAGQIGERQAEHHFSGFELSR
jgi:hypothetical protein